LKCHKQSDGKRIGKCGLLFHAPRMKRVHFFATILATAVFIFSQTAVSSGQEAAPTNDTPSVAIYPESDDLFLGKGPLQRAPWFKNLWAARRTEWWNNREKDKGAVVFLGDSITQGWGNLQTNFPGMKIANRGISGDTSRGVLYRLREDVLDLDPEAIVLLIGTNDIGLDGSPEDVAYNIKLILAAIRSYRPNTPVVLCKIMPASEKVQRPADKIKRVNELVDELVKNQPGIIRVDTWSIFADEAGSAKKEEFPDLLHPNAAGYAKWAEALKPAFAKLNKAK